MGSNFVSAIFFSFLTLDMLFSFSDLQFSHLQNEDNKSSYYYRILVMIKSDHVYKAEYDAWPIVGAYSVTAVIKNKCFSLFLTYLLTFFPFPSLLSFLPSFFSFLLSFLPFSGNLNKVVFPWASHPQS